MKKQSPQLAVFLGLALLLTPQILLAQNGAPTTTVRQDGTQDADKETLAEAPERPADLPLAPLPVPPSQRPSAPRPLSMEAIDSLLQRVISDDPVTRTRASRSLLEAKQDWVGGISRRIDQIAERAQRREMKKLLSHLRDRSKQAMREEGVAQGATPDYLLTALQFPDPASQTWKDLTQLLSLSRMLGAIGTTEALREMIRIYVRFGEFMRIDCQRQLEALGDQAIAPLIETTRHPAPNVAAWATKRLKLRKKLTAHQAVRTDDPKALAEILIALGRTRDPESARLLISFAGTEQIQVRLAARQAIALQGDVAAWQLKDAYLNTTGKRPPRAWSWKRLARELFTEFDRLRLAQLYEIYGGAKKAAAEGDWKKMREGYDRVLTLNPSFNAPKEMSLGYIEYAKQVQETNPDEAILALRRAARIAPDEETRIQSLARRHLAEAIQLRKKGIYDRSLFEQAAQLDPTLTEARLDPIEKKRTPSHWAPLKRYIVATSVSLIALLGAFWILLSMRNRSPILGSPADDQKSDELPAAAIYSPTDATPTLDNDNQLQKSPQQRSTATVPPGASLPVNDEQYAEIPSDNRSDPRPLGEGDDARKTEI